MKKKQYFYEFYSGQTHEYWGDDGIAPQWRQDKKIGKPIK